MVYREEPVPGAYHSNESLDYFVRFPAGLPDAVPAPLDGRQDVSVCVSRLGEGAGVSDLDVVSFFEDDDITTRARLRTTWFTSRGKEFEEHHFEWQTAEWQLRLHYAESEDCHWVLLLNDLMTGASDRAVLHRRQRLEEYDRTFSDSEERSWAAVWDELPIESPNQMVANHLAHTYVDDDGNEAYAPMVTLSAYGDYEMIDLRLPCGHETDAHVGMLKLLSREECLGLCCDVCHKRVMDSRDDRLLQLAADRTHRNEWAFDQIYWEGLDEEISDWRLVSATGAQLFESIELALSSMKVPQSITPIQLDLTSLKETKIILGYFQALLANHETKFEVSPEKIRDELTHHVNNAFHDSSSDLSTLAFTVPLGFEAFFETWLNRAVKHSLDPVARGQDRMADFDDVTERLRQVGMNETEPDPEDHDWMAQLDSKSSEHDQAADLSAVTDQLREVEIAESGRDLGEID